MAQEKQDQNEWQRGTETTDTIHVNPLFAQAGEKCEIPRFKIPYGSMSSEAAYQLITDEMMLDGNARQNLATFVTTWMDSYADKLYQAAFSKNMIDKNEYPQTAAIEQRCINMIADLWNSPEPKTTRGASTIGSSEACMLAGLALKKRWQALRRAAGKSTEKPNIVFSSTVQVVWEKFANYWDVEARYIPVSEENPNMNPAALKDYVDENTIGVVAILGVTYTGSYEPVKEICAALDEIQKETGIDIPLHVDAASGGFIAPFIEPDYEWDFRIDRVYSISASGHKFGLVYPGLGWVVWRKAENVPEEMIFWVSYLGGNMADLSINFSRPGAQVLLQYYNFLHLGKEGYYRTQLASLENARYTAKRISKMAPFELFTSAEHMPLVTWKMKPGYSDTWDIYDLSDKLRGRGWQVPAYPMPADCEDINIMRIVFRNGVSRDLCDMLLEDMEAIIKEFDKLETPLPHAASHLKVTYNHN